MNHRQKFKNNGKRYFSHNNPLLAKILNLEKVKTLHLQLNGKNNIEEEIFGVSPGLSPTLTRTHDQNTTLLDELNKLSNRESKIQDEAMDEITKLNQEIKINDNSKPKNEVKNALRKCVKKVMLMNSLKRGKDIILQTTSPEDPAFNRMKDIMNVKKKSVRKLKPLVESINQNETPKKNFHVIDLGNYKHGQAIDKKIFKKLPGYYHKVADKYLKLHIQSPPKPGMSKSHSKASSRNEAVLPFIRNTSQGT